MISVFTLTNIFNF